MTNTTNETIYQKKYTSLAPGKNLIMVGFGAIGQGVLPLILNHVDLKKEQIVIITGDNRGEEKAKAEGITFLVSPLNKRNYKEVLAPYLTVGSFLVNVSVEVASMALIELCKEKDVLYVDTCSEPWAEDESPDLSLSLRSNYAERDEVVRNKEAYKGGPTAVITHGANPGMVSHFVKKAMLDIAKDTGEEVTEIPQTREQWAALAQKLGIKVIHIAERDYQIAANRPKRKNEFLNTWSVDGFIFEGCYQPSELGWGTHEKHFPEDGFRHKFGCDSAIYLGHPGCQVKVRSWTPLGGVYNAFLITHAESISISDYLTIKDEKGVPTFRPTVHYSYEPFDGAVLSIHELQGRNFEVQKTRKVLVEEITEGIDELGVLLMGHKKGAYWFGSQLSVQETRTIFPWQTATGLQVCASLFSSIIWVLENPRKGIVEPDEMPFDRLIEVAKPYLGPLVGQYSDWTPLEGRQKQFLDKVDESDPWQFLNFRVHL